MVFVLLTCSAVLSIKSHNLWGDCLLLSCITVLWPSSSQTEQCQLKVWTQGLSLGLYTCPGWLVVFKVGSLEGFQGPFSKKQNNLFPLKFQNSMFVSHVCHTQYTNFFHLSLLIMWRQYGLPAALWHVFCANKTRGDNLPSEIRMQQMWGEVYTELWEKVYHFKY